MISRKEILKSSRRSDHEDNVWVHPFSGRMASWFTWAFVNLGLSANQVTFLSFVSGVIAAGVLLSDNVVAAFTAFALFRLHVVLDASDGEVARYRNQTSQMGVYWDQSMHMIVYPLIFACLVWGRLLNDADMVLVVFGMLGVVGKIIDLGVQNAYYRVLYNSGTQAQISAASPVSNSRPSPVRSFWNFMLHFSGYDGLLFFFAAAYFVNSSWLGLEARDWAISAYGVNLVLMAMVRMVLIPYRDRIPMRKDLR